MDLIFNRIEVIMGLLEGVLPRFGLPSHLEEKILRVGLLDLTKIPVFHLKNNQAHILAVEQEIRFVSVDVRRVPAEIVRIGLANASRNL